MKKIVAIGGGNILNNETKDIDKYIVELSEKKIPKVLFIPTASRDDDDYIKAFKNNYKSLGAKVNILYLYKSKYREENIRRQILDSDIVYIGDGDIDQAIKIWERYNISKYILEAYNRGIIMCSIGLASFIWFDWAYMPDKLNKKIEGLNIISIGLCPNYDDNIKDYFDKFMMEQDESALALEKNTAMVSRSGKKRDNIYIIKSDELAKAYHIDYRSGRIWKNDVVYKKAYLGELIAVRRNKEIEELIRIRDIKNFIDDFPKDSNILFLNIDKNSENYRVKSQRIDLINNLGKEYLDKDYNIRYIFLEEIDEMNIKDIKEKIYNSDLIVHTEHDYINGHVNKILDYKRMCISEMIADSIKKGVESLQIYPAGSSGLILDNTSNDEEKYRKKRFDNRIEELKIKYRDELVPNKREADQILDFFEKYYNIINWTGEYKKKYIEIFTKNILLNEDTNPGYKLGVEDLDISLYILNINERTREFYYTDKEIDDIKSGKVNNKVTWFIRMLFDKTTGKWYLSGVNPNDKIMDLFIKTVAIKGISKYDIDNNTGNLVEYLKYLEKESIEEDNNEN